MKWGIVILLLLGLVAAGSAAVLMGTLRVRPRAAQQESEKVEVAMAKRSLNAGTIITVDLINTEEVARDELPPGQLVTSLQATGRVLGLPVVEGQVLTEACLVPEGTGAILASQIPEGMRAFSVPITSRARPDQILLYPGCVVDVLVEYKLNRNAEGEAYCNAMFRGIRVLAISGDSVLKNPDAEDGDNKRNSNRGGMIVSLLVEPKQVEALQLAVENGSITMSLRNPLDKKNIPSEGLVLDRNSFVKSGSRVPSTVRPESANGYDLFSEWIDANEPLGQGLMADNPVQDNIFNRPERITPRMKPRWQVETILGREKKLDEFENPEIEAEKTAQEK